MKRSPVFLVVALLIGACRNDAWDLQRMIHQPRATTYRSARAFGNGQVLQSPPDGAIAIPADSTGELLARSVAMGRHVGDSAADRVVAEGRAQFMIFCAVCHGAGGYGGGLVAANMHGLRPASLRSRMSAAASPEAIYAKITMGGARMPVLAEALTPEQRWSVAAYIQRLRTTPAAADSAARNDSLRAAALAHRDSVGTRP